MLTKWVVRNSISGIVSSIDCLENITEQFGKMSGQSHTGTSLLPDLPLYGFVWIQFQINHFCFSEKYADFIHRQSATDYKAHGSDFRGDKYHRSFIQTKNDGSLVQIPPFIDWTGTAEMTLSLRVDLVLSYTVDTNET